jgi:two-component system, LuxR family, response regulator FixJ
MPTNPTVFVVDDDQQARESVCALVSSMGVNAQAFSSAEEFLERYVDGAPGCLVTDLRMLGISGIELLARLRQAKIFLPAIVLTAYARTPTTVQAIKAGAMTLLEKPYTDDDLWDAIRKALAEDAARRPEHQRRRAIQTRLDSLTDEERTVLKLVVAAKPNKAIAALLGVSVRTIENRRREMLAKMDAGSVAELVRMVVEAEPDS